MFGFDSGPFNSLSTPAKLQMILFLICLFILVSCTIMTVINTSSLFVFRIIIYVIPSILYLYLSILALDCLYKSTSPKGESRQVLAWIMIILPILAFYENYNLCCEYILF